ncbi:hypothetical protein [Synechococcus elongatus]|uniref:hypothetical protein n=1 Tax=Synechococcus elongatus TaxID=32046 RepID=UPI000F7E3ECB|nr:hypothetical protein [Synechococcus elongatus]
MKNPVDVTNPSSLAAGYQAKKELLGGRPQVYGTRTSDSGEGYFGSRRREAFLAAAERRGNLFAEDPKLASAAVEDFMKHWINSNFNPDNAPLE